MTNLYMGFDLSTQQLKLTVIDEDSKIVLEDSVHFDKELRHYGTLNGVVADGCIVTSPVLMWVESVDLLLHKLKSQGFPFNKVKAISGAAQQHGSVYWCDSALDTLTSLDPSKTLVSQLANSFTIPNSPTWQDSSTYIQCKNLEELIGGPEMLMDITGSRGFERFTGNQIAKVRYAPIDVSDGSGMNLLDIREKTWDNRLLEICSNDQIIDNIRHDNEDIRNREELKLKLGDPVIDGLMFLGNINEYFVKRYKFSKDCKINSFTGDNPATMLSFYLQPGDAIISLGTSDTVLIYTTIASPTLESHTLYHPIDPDAFISMLCYKNGSLAREYVRDMYCPKACVSNDPWLEFSERLAATSPDPAKIGFYFLFQEIIPFAKGIYRFYDKKLVEEFMDSPEYNIKAIIESQFMSMKLRTNQLTGGNVRDLRDNHEREKGNVAKRILVVGGASKNNEILQVLADIFGVDVWRCANGNSASFGAATKARMAFLRTIEAPGVFGMNRKEFPTNARNLNNCELVAKPRKEYHAIYLQIMEDYQELEKIVIEKQNYSH
ncbi:17651_t:CDS:2 [Acaulospora morrowiae]|uniref:Xylulose kinase n=1 Tax=Acaulospora morrowiae TaxID=94023 RepID=A0A9N9DCE8_9GLOM|nr:17651_t:CDS:2 [Acaulospora morrowiae]